jgi:GlpG protein
VVCLYKGQQLRSIGTIEGEGYARSFGYYLSSQGIEAQFEETTPGRWEVWVLDEDKLEAARGYLAEFAANPHSDRYANATLQAAERKVLEAGVARQPQVIRRGAIFSGTAFHAISLSTALIAISIFAAVITMLGRDARITGWLSITAYNEAGDRIVWLSGLPEVCHGQVWRLLTPIFLHFSVLHILFNMLWLRDLGSLIEARDGTWKLLLLVVVIGVLSNFGQYLIGGPAFGGMSGVVYGLFGYVWIRGKLDPSSGFFLTDQTIMIMVGWFVMCLVGFVGNVANGAHGVGLATGMAFGWLAARKPVGFRRRM